MSKELREEIEKETVKIKNHVGQIMEAVLVDDVYNLMLKQEQQNTKLEKKINTLVLDVADHVNDKLELKADLKACKVIMESQKAEIEKLKSMEDVFKTESIRLQEYAIRVQELEAEVKRLEESKEKEIKMFTEWLLDEGFVIDSEKSKLDIDVLYIDWVTPQKPEQ